MEHVNDNSNANYGVGNKIIYNTEVLKSNLCYYNDAYILVKSNTVAAVLTTEVAFKIVHHLLNVSQRLMEQQ